MPKHSTACPPQPQNTKEKYCVWQGDLVDVSKLPSDVSNVTLGADSNDQFRHLISPRRLKKA